MVFRFVSIPHRYGKNDRPGGKELIEIMFPFLIGTVRTLLWCVRDSKIRWFPFLIGTVRTYYGVLGTAKLDGFHSS